MAGPEARPAQAPLLLIVRSFAEIGSERSAALQVVVEGDQPFALQKARAFLRMTDRPSIARDSWTVDRPAANNLRAVAQAPQLLRQEASPRPVQPRAECAATAPVPTVQHLQKAPGQCFPSS